MSRNHDVSIKLRGRYSRDNFTNNAKLWEKHVLPHLSRQKQKRAGTSRLLRVLLIETAEEGMVIEFLNSHAMLRGFQIETVALTEKPEAALAKNMALLKRAVTVIPGDVEVTMLRMAYECKTHVQKPWDLVYIEGLDAETLLRLAALAFTCTAPGGLLVFDDYTYSFEHDTSCPRRGVDAFSDTHSRSLRSIGPSGWQAIFCKRTRPLNLKPCSSEFYA